MDRLKIIVGAVLSVPPFSPGMAWNWMQLVQGLQRLGHDLVFIEEVDPAWCVDGVGRTAPLSASVNQRTFLEATGHFAPNGRACQLMRDGSATTGLDWESVKAAAADADLLINISGHIQAEGLLDTPARRVYIDQDPAYTQLWFAEYGEDLGFSSHEVFFTVGLNIGTSRSPIPDCGRAWQHTLPVVIAELWPESPGPASGPFTTIASWSSYGDLCYRGAWYRSKYAEFRRFARLPRRVNEPLEVLLKRFRPDDEGVGLLKAGGWQVGEAARLGGLGSYQDYIRASRAEIGIAKNAYVRGRTGWFGDRAAHYLASGRPVLHQSTGFEHRLPTGDGIITFSDLDEAAAGIEAVASAYEHHCRAARNFAEEFLDYRKVLPTFLDDCFRTAEKRSVTRA
jgi:hypothetical protein